MSANEPEETYLTVAEVAETLKLNQQTVRNWIDQGSLPALRVGRRVRIKRSDFERILERSYSPGAGPPASPGPSAEDFWGGEPVGLAEPGPERTAAADQRNGTTAPVEPQGTTAPARPNGTTGNAPPGGHDGE